MSDIGIAVRSASTHLVEVGGAAIQLREWEAAGCCCLAQFVEQVRFAAGIQLPLDFVAHDFGGPVQELASASRLSRRRLQSTGLM